MNWSGITRALLHTKSIVNAVVMFFAGYGVCAVLHVPGSWGVYVGLGAIIVNQIGLHQLAPGTE